MGRLLSESIPTEREALLQSPNTTKQEETDAWMASPRDRCHVSNRELPFFSPFSFILSNFSLSLSFFLSSRDFSFRQLRHAYHAQDTSGENKLGLFIGLIKKIKQKKRKAWLRGRLKIKTTILFAR